MKSAHSARTAKLQVELLEDRLVLSGNPISEAITLENPPIVNNSAHDDHGHVLNSSASSISINSTGRGSVSGSLERIGDRDAFRVQARTAGILRVHLQESGSRVDTYLRIYDSNGRLLTENDDYGGSRNSYAQVLVQGGTFYISAGSYGDSGTGEYRINVEAPVSTRDDHRNTVSSNARRIELDSNGNGTATGKLETAGDRDVFKFTTKSAGQLVAKLSERGSNVDTYLRVYNSEGNLIAENDDDGHTFNSEVKVNITAGTWYISAGSFRDEGIGEYEITINAPGTPDDFGDYPSATSTRLNLNKDGDATVAGNLEQEGDRDAFRLIIAKGGQVVLAANTPDSAMNPYLRVYNSHGAEIARDNDSGPGRDSRVALNLDAGTYFVTVAAHRDAGKGTYELVVDAPTPPAPASEFDIEVRFIDNNLSASQKAVFQEAADRWAEIILGDLPAATTDIGVVDDLVIDASAPSIDGAYGILGQAGPTAVRRGSYLPVRGIMMFDSADLAMLERTGQLLDVILHEMGHVLGIGTLWSYKGLVRGSGTSNPTFIGANAMRVYGEMFGLSGPTAVPLANTGSQGTRESHWRESVFDNEFMTGVLNTGRENPISRLTIASLIDLGYTVNMAAADVYVPPGGVRGAQSDGGGGGGAAAFRSDLEEDHDHDHEHDHEHLPPLTFTVVPTLDAPGDGTVTSGSGSQSESQLDAFFLSEPQLRNLVQPIAPEVGESIVIDGEEVEAESEDSSLQFFAASSQSESEDDPFANPEDWFGIV